ncbi:Ubiquitin-associated protein 2-like [Plecturocebus cupreus]
MSTSSSQSPSNLYTSTTSGSSSTVSSSQSQESEIHTDLAVPQLHLFITPKRPDSGKEWVQFCAGHAVIDHMLKALQALRIPHLNETVSAASLPMAINQHSSSLGGLSHSEEVPNTNTAQPSSTLSTKQNTLSSSPSSGHTSTSTLLHTSVEGEANLHSSSSTFFTTCAPPLVVSVSSSLNSGSSLGLSLGSNSTVTALTRSSVATTSGKAPPTSFLGFHCCRLICILWLQGSSMPTHNKYMHPISHTHYSTDWEDGSLASNAYSGDFTKFSHGDACPLAPARTLAQPQQDQMQTHNTMRQTFQNLALPPGYRVLGLPGTFQFGPAVFPVTPTPSKQHGVNVSVNASAPRFPTAKWIWVSWIQHSCFITSSNIGVPDILGSMYSKTQQSLEKQDFHSNTSAASYNFSSALGSGDPINPATAAAYQPDPFMHLLTPHQQPYSQILHHHLQPFGQMDTEQCSQTSSILQKPQTNKSAYNSYSWGPTEALTLFSWSHLLRGFSAWKLW